MQHKIEAPQGWDAIRQAANAAAHGDEIVLGAGVFTGRTTIQLPSGVALVGQEDTLLQYSGRASAIIAAEAADVLIEGIRIECTPIEGEPDLVQTPTVEAAEDNSFSYSMNFSQSAGLTDAIKAHNAVIAITHCQRVTVRNCQVATERACEGSIHASHSDECEVAGNSCSGGTYGIRFYGSHGRIAGNECTGATLGIELHCAHGVQDRPSQASIIANHCSKGEQGIALISSTSGDVRDNECFENQNGIYLGRCPESPTRGAAANITGNHFHHNRANGISLHGADTCEVSKNLCEANSENGILCIANDAIANDDARSRISNNRCVENRFGILVQSQSPAISGNRCENNEQTGIQIYVPDPSDARTRQCVIEGNCASGHDRGAGIEVNIACIEAVRNNDCAGNRNGIALFGAQCEDIEQNRCTGNANGISLDHETTLGNLISRATLRANICKQNREFGITVLSADARLIGNECAESGYSGILVRDNAKRLQEVDIVIEGNLLHHNTESGAVIAGAFVRQITDNQCFENSKDGFGLQGLSAKQPCSAGIIGNNSFLNNEHSGLRLSSASAVIEENFCQANSQSGIVLERLKDNIEVPSRAQIRSNSCCENGQAGIDLYSAIAEEISENRCNHNSKSGILLGIDQNAQDEPSRAVISGNTCNHNSDYGIGLFSSIAENIEGNEIAFNKLSGILLSRSKLTEGTQSAARIVRNDCGANGENGIGLFSSTADVVEENNCWQNGMNGIVVQPLQSIPETPSHASLSGNRCHDNVVNGISIVASHADEISGNACWANGNNGIGLFPYGDDNLPASARIIDNDLHDNRLFGLLVRLSENLGIEGNRISGSGNRTDLAFQRLEGSEWVADDPHGPVAGNRIASEETGTAIPLENEAIKGFTKRGIAVKPARALAGFVDSPDCSWCFARAASQYGTAPRVVDESAAEKQAGEGHRHFRIRWRMGQADVTPVNTAHSRPIAAVGDILSRQQRQLRNGKPPDPEWAALVSADDGDIEQLCDLIENIRAGSPGASGDAAHPIQQAQVFDLGARSGLDSADPHHGLFERELLTGPAWRARLDCLWRLPEVWLVGAALLAALYFNPLSLSGIEAAVAAQLAKGAAHLAWSAALLVIVAAVTIGYLNLRLPSILRLGSAPLMWLATTANVVISVVPQDLLQRLDQRFGESLRKRIVRPMRDRAWRVWTRRKLLAAGPGVYPIVLTNLESWRADDLRRLRMLLANKQEDTALALIAQVDGRASVFPVFLKLQKESGWPDKFELLLNDFDDDLRLKAEDLQGIAQDGDPSLECLGITSGSQSTEYRELRGSLVDETWWPIDLLPALTIGSAPSAKFSVRRKVMLGISDSLRDEFAGFDRVVSGPATTSAWADEQVRELFVRAPDVPSIRSYSTTDKRQEFERIAGRIGMRREVARTLACLWGDEELARDCMAEAIQCAVLSHQNAVLDAIGGGGENAASIAIRALDAVRFLATDLAALGCSEHPVAGEDLLANNWQRITAIIDRAGSAGALGEGAGALYCAFLGAFAAHMPGECDGRIADDNALLATLLTDSDPAPSEPSLRQAALQQIAHQLRLLSYMESPLAEQAITRFRQQGWHRLPPAMAQEVAQLVDAAFSQRRSLRQLLAAARDETELELVIRLHSGDPAKLLFHLASIALHDIAGRANGKEAAIAIGKSVMDILRALRPTMETGELARRLKEEMREAVGQSASQSGKVAADYLLNTGAASRLEMLLRPAETPAVAIPFVLDIELDRLLLLAETILKREFAASGT